jgi:TRAP-type C4-dicarboxylate transport system permease small subunit
VFERLARAIEIALGLALIAAVLINFAGVLGRYLFGVAVLGADEVQIFLMVWITFLGAAIVTWRGQHLRMDVLVAYLPAKARAALRLVEALTLLALACVVVWQSALYVHQMMAVDRRSDAAGIPMALPHAAVLAGFVLIVLIAAARLRRR